MSVVTKNIQSFLQKFPIAYELLTYLWSQKLWWLIPMILTLLLFAFLLLFAQGTGVAPFVYTLF